MSEKKYAEDGFMFWWENRPVPQDWFDGGIESEAVGNIARVCHKNINRILLLPEIIREAFVKGAFHGLSYLVAHHRMFGIDNPPTGMESPGGENSKEFNDLVERIRNGDLEVPPWQNTVGFPSAFPYISVYEMLSDQIESLMLAQIVSAWTTFETLAEDLWKAAMNANPKGLAALNGDPYRITRLVKRVPSEDPNQDDKESVNEAADERLKLVSLSEIWRVTEGTLVLTERLGDLLCSKFNFTRLKGIRRAYSIAFSEQHKEATAAINEIDSALASRDLDAIRSARNLIVHNNAVADVDYEKISPSLPGGLRLKNGERLRLSTQSSLSAIDSIIRPCRGLIRGVNAWLKIMGK